jgi:hypothetical protein
MPILDILADIDSVLEDPSLITFGLAGLVGLLGLAALFFLYPFSRD